jgi:hypothetical protein
MRILFYASLIIGTLTTLVSAWLMNNGFIVSLYYPIFGIIMIGEIYYYMDGKLYKAKESDLAGEEDKANRIYDYTFMRSILSRVFGDKLLADNTTVNSDLFSTKTNTVHIDELLEAGVNIYMYKKGFLHAKLLVSDDVLSTVGSTNMDFRSFEHNFEANAFMYDRCVAVTLKNTFISDQKNALSLSVKNWRKRSWYQKSLESVIRLFAPLL